jgi:hypothetical protein
MKKCGKCQIEKDFCFFGKDLKRKDGLRPHCNDCRKKESLEYRNKNKEKRSDTQKKYRESHSNYYHNYYCENKEIIREYNKNYYKDNKDRLIENMVQYTNERLKTDTLFKLSHIVRTRIYKIIKINNINKSVKTFDIVGCSPKFLKEYLEKKFIDGMRWDNRSEWHIDHIIPLSTAKTEEEIYELCHYTNLQPLWAEDNLKKSNKIL